MRIKLSEELQEYLVPKHEIITEKQVRLDIANKTYEKAITIGNYEEAKLQHEIGLNLISDLNALKLDFWGRIYKETKFDHRLKWSYDGVQGHIYGGNLLEGTEDDKG